MRYADLGKNHHSDCYGLNIGVGAEIEPSVGFTQRDRSQVDRNTDGVVGESRAAGHLKRHGSQHSKHATTS